MDQKLFSPIKIGTLTLRNRTVRSATHEGLADESGFYTAALTNILRQLAEGGVGLLISGHAFVSPEGRAGRFQAAADRDECIEHWKPALDAVHRAGGAIALQLAHAGGNAADPASAIGPSPYAASPNRPECREMTEDEIHALTKKFADAAARAKRAGFDAVQIHAAHGYLLSEFLSGSYNRRRDFYGETLANRSRFLLEVYDAVRNAVGPEFPILVKINSNDFTDDGLSTEECVAVCRKLEARGIDAIELSGGLPIAPSEYVPVRKAGEPPYYMAAATKLNAALSIPIILVGGIGRFETACHLLNSNHCDLVSFSRPLIREPGLIARWQHSGDRTPAKCIRCNGCFRPILLGRGFRCVKESRSEM